MIFLASLQQRPRIFLILGMLGMSCMPVAGQVEHLIRSVQVHAPGQTEYQDAVNLHAQNLILEFDDLQPNQEDYFLRIAHRNYDWSPSSLRDLDYINSFNEIAITKIEYSIDESFPYVHYEIELPKVKIAGNYLVQVYRNQNKADLVLEVKLLVFQTGTSLENLEPNLVAGRLADSFQQLNFKIGYQNLQVNNPQRDLVVVVRQNRRWDNLRSGIPPTYLDEFGKKLEFRHFEQENLFPAGNEFRFFDIRSLNNPGRNVLRVERTETPLLVVLQPDLPRENQSYSQYADANGKFRLENLDFRDNTFAAYIRVMFSLKAPKIPEEVYVTGAFCNWAKDDSNRLVYDDQLGSYVGEYLLKQGHYDYVYVTNPSTAKSFPEGNFFQTENEYEVLIYQKSLQPFADLLVGYHRIRAGIR